LYLSGADSYTNFDRITAQKLLRKAEQYGTQAGDLKLLSEVNLGLGENYSDGGDFVNASKHLQEAVRLCEITKDTTFWFFGRISLAGVYSRNKFFDMAEQERVEIINLAKTTKNYKILAMNYFNGSYDYREIGDENKRIKSLKEALRLVEEENVLPHLIGIFKSELAGAYAQNDSIIKAKKLLDEIQNDPDKHINNYTTAYIEKANSIYSFAVKDFEKVRAIEEERRPRLESYKNIEELLDMYNRLSKTYDSLGYTTLAYENFKKHQKIKDSIGNVLKTNALVYYQTLYETEKRDSKIKIQNAEISLLAEKGKRKTIILIGLIFLLVLLSVGYYMFYTKNLERKKKELQEVLSQELIKTQESERKRVALELHDDIGQQLMLLLKKVSKLQINDVTSLAQNAVQKLRTISQGLYPTVLKRLGFTAALEDLLYDFDENSNVFFTIELENVESHLTQESTLHIYRICQEIVSNTLKHANAKAIFIAMKNKNLGWELIIKDNGKGFDYEGAKNNSKSLGLYSILERCKIIGADVQVNTSLNKGTEYKITFSN